MNWIKVLRVVRFELAALVKRKEFWLSALTLPFLVAIGVYGRTLLFSALPAVPRVDSRPSSQTVGLVDESRLLVESSNVCASALRKVLALGMRALSFSPADELSPPPSGMRCFPSVEEAKGALAKGDLAAIVQVPADFNETGRYTVFANTEWRDYMFTTSFESFHRDRLIRSYAIPESLKSRLLTAPVWDKLVKKGEGFEPVSPQAPPSGGGIFGGGLFRSVGQITQMKNRALGCVAGVIAVMLMGASFLTGLKCTQVERNSHLIEAIITSVTPGEYLAGKILSTGIGTFLGFAVSLTGTALIFSSSASIVTLLRAFVPMPSIAVLLTFITAVGLGATMMGALGAAIGVTIRPEHQGRNSVPAVGVLVPQLVFLASIFACYFPDHWTVLAAWYIPPFTAPLAVMRQISSGLSFAEGLYFVSAMLLGVIGACILATRVMRICLVMESFSFRGIFRRWFRSARRA